MLLSPMGMQAISDITSVMTSSNGSISPICRLPMSLIITSRTAKMISPLKNIVNIILFCGLMKKIYENGLQTRALRL